MLLVPLFLLAVAIAATASSAAISTLPTRRNAATVWAASVGIDLIAVAVSRGLSYWLVVVLVLVTTIGALAAAGHLLRDTDPAANKTGS